MDIVKTKLKELLDSIYELADLYYKLNKISVGELNAIKYLNYKGLDNFNTTLTTYVEALNNDLNNKEAKEELFNCIKNYYIKCYLPAWKNRNISNYYKLEWEIKEAIYISLVKILF